jgi:hypothetical protein
VAVNGLIEGRAGNAPFTEPENRSDVYGQVDLEARSGPLLVGARYEFDQSSQEIFAYRSFTRRFAEWQAEHLRLHVGNLFGILGRGLLFRAFELPSVILDDPVTQARYGFSRDLDGVSIASEWGPVEMLGLAGQPNGGEASPAAEALGFARYDGQLAGAQATVALPRDARVGAAYLRFTSDGVRQLEFGSGFVEGDPLRLAGVKGVAAPVYLEYAEQDARFGEWWRFRASDRVPHAFYAGANLLWNRLTLSLEWKDYAGFRHGFNDPPSLVKEHAWAILNRNTHLLNAQDEEGYQIEASWTQPPWGSIEVNRTRSDGFFVPRAVRFEESFASLHLQAAERPWEASTFVDLGRDGFQFIQDRHGFGGSGTIRFLGAWSVAGDLELQRSERVPSTRIHDTYASLSVARAGWGTASLLWERTTDPEQEEPDQVPIPGVAPRRFLAGQIVVRLTESQEATVFAGTRRGGRACTAGTCYEVEPFEGVELRLTSRLTPY